MSVKCTNNQRNELPPFSIPFNGQKSRKQYIYTCVFLGRKHLDKKVASNLFEKSLEGCSGQLKLETHNINKWIQDPEHILYL